MTSDPQKRAMAAREAREALLQLKKLVDETTETTHVAELQAIGFAVRPGQRVDALTTLRTALESLRSPHLETAINQACERLEFALSI